MKLLFKRAVADRQRAEVAASATAAAKLAELRAERDRVLNADTDDLAGVVAADAAVAAQEKIVAIHQQRLQSLDAELQQERTAERERRKAAVIEKVAQGFAARTAAAEKLERALANLAASYNGYVETSRNATAAWDTSVLPALRGEFATVDNTATWLGATLRIEVGSASVMLAEAGVRTEGLGRRAGDYAASFIESLKEAPLPEAFEDEERAA
jgi:hypothetical protein